MRLFSNRSQVASKCGKNKEVAHEPQASVSLSKTTFRCPPSSITEHTHSNMESICFIQLSEKKKKSQTLYFVSASAFFLYLTCIQFPRKVFQRLFLLKAEYWRKTVSLL